MNCSRFETLVQDVARDCLAEEPVRAQLAEHAASCPGCARRLAAEQSLTAMFKVAASEKEEAPPRIEAALISSFRERHAEWPRDAAWWFMSWRPSLLRVCVALPLIGILLAAAYIQIRHFAGQAGSRSAILRTLVPRTGTSLPAAKESAPERAATRAQAVRALARPEAAQPINRRQLADAHKDAATPEIATDFIALTSAAELSSMESGQLVRVMLPRSSLASFGLPFNQELREKPVAAQVLIGQDGVARAIRFLQDPDVRFVQTGMRSKR
jgi:hypothetical protein